MKVTNLQIQLQSGTQNTVYASWDFTDKVPTGGGSGGGGGAGGSVKAGSIVRIKAGSRWYNGAGIASYVMNYRWTVLEVRGDRAVLHRSPDLPSAGIMSPISTNNLTVVG